MRQLLALGIVFCVLAGCGGADSSSASNFAGNFGGDWSEGPPTPDLGTSPRGTINISVGPTGDVSGLFVRTFPDSFSGQMSGHLDHGGHLEFDVESGAGPLHYAGTVHLVGNTLTGPFGEVGVTYNFTPTMTLLKLLDQP